MQLWVEKKLCVLCNRLDSCLRLRKMTIEKWQKIENWQKKMTIVSHIAFRLCTHSLVGSLYSLVQQDLHLDWSVSPWQKQQWQVWQQIKLMNKWIKAWKYFSYTYTKKSDIVFLGDYKSDWQRPCWKTSIWLIFMWLSN